MIFVDTSFFFPLLSARDTDHKRVRQIFEEFRGTPLREVLLTTNWVVAETVTLIRMTPPRSHAAAVRAGDSLFSEVLGRVHWASREDEENAYAYLKKYGDKEYSFVDCLSFVVMDKLGITEALAVDSDFTHRFTARPGPR